MGRSRKQELRTEAVLDELSEIVSKQEAIISCPESTEEEIFSAKIGHAAYVDAILRIRRAFGLEVREHGSELSNSPRICTLEFQEPHRGGLSFMPIEGPGHDYVHSLSFVVGSRHYLGHFVWRHSGWVRGKITKLYRSNRPTSSRTIPKGHADRYWAFLQGHPRVQQHLNTSLQFLQTLERLDDIRIEDARVLDHVRLAHQRARAVELKLRGLDYLFTLFYDLQFQRCVGCEVAGLGHTIRSGPIVLRVKDQLVGVLDVPGIDHDGAKTP